MNLVNFVFSLLLFHIAPFNTHFSKNQPPISPSTRLKMKSFERIKFCFKKWLRRAEWVRVVRNKITFVENRHCRKTKHRRIWLYFFPQRECHKMSYLRGGKGVGDPFGGVEGKNERMKLIVFWIRVVFMAQSYHFIIPQLSNNVRGR